MPKLYTCKALHTMGPGEEACAGLRRRGWRGATRTSVTIVCNWGEWLAPGIGSPVCLAIDMSDTCNK